MLKHVPPGGSWVNMPVEIQKKYMGKSFYSSGGRRGMGRRIA
jgi:DNA (cytosine-5)-methyltransferase 1